MATIFTNRWVVIIPANVRDNVNTRLQGLGYGSNTFSVALAAAGNPAVITHYGCNWQLTPTDRANIETYCRNNNISGQTIWSRLIVADLSGYDPLTAVPTFASVLAANNLVRYQG